MFRAIGFEREILNGGRRAETALALIMGDVTEEAPLLRLLIYEHQEGRGIGLMAKLQAYELQDKGLDTIEANRALGFAADCRDFGLPVAVLHDLGVSRVRLLSNNPEKARALLDAGIEVVAQVPCEAQPNPGAARPDGSSGRSCSPRGTASSRRDLRDCQR
jgi:GTP cyclohydrolase II